MSVGVALDGLAELLHLQLDTAEPFEIRLLRFQHARLQGG